MTGDQGLHPDRRPSAPLIFAITVTGITTNTLITPALPDILRGLDVSPAFAGLLISAATLPGIALAPVIGVLADRYGRREVLVPCLVLFSLAGLSASAAPSFPVLVLLRFLQGAGSAGLINLAIVIIGDHWSGIDRARMIGRNAAVLTVCLAIFPSLGGVLTDLGSWRTPFLLYGLGLVTAVVLARRLPGGETREVGLGDQLREAWPHLRRPEVLAVMAASAVVFALIFGALLTVVPVYIEQRFGLGASWRGVILGAPAVGSTLAALSLGRLTARLGRRRLLLVAGGILVAALVTVAAAPSLLVLVVGVVLFGLGEGSTVPTLQDLVAGTAGRESRGALVASQVSSARTGQTLGPLALGATFDAAGAAPAFLGAAAVAGVVLIPLLLRSTAVDPTGQRQTSSSEG